MVNTIAARPTTYNGIKMRSRLEARFAAWLDNHHSDWMWRYEPRCFASQAGQYLPDFLILIDDKWSLYIDVKPPPSSIASSHAEFRPVLDRMDIIKASDPSSTNAIVHPSIGKEEVFAFYAEGRDFALIHDLLAPIYYSHIVPLPRDEYGDTGWGPDNDPGRFNLHTD